MTYVEFRRAVPRSTKLDGQSGLVQAAVFSPCRSHHGADHTLVLGARRLGGELRHLALLHPHKYVDYVRLPAEWLPHSDWCSRALRQRARPGRARTTRARRRSGTADLGCAVDGGATAPRRTARARPVADVETWDEPLPAAAFSTSAAASYRVASAWIVDVDRPGMSRRRSLQLLGAEACLAAELIEVGSTPAPAETDRPPARRRRAERNALLLGRDVRATATSTTRRRVIKRRIAPDRAARAAQRPRARSAAATDGARGGVRRRRRRRLPGGGRRSPTQVLVAWRQARPARRRSGAWRRVRMLWPRDSRRRRRTVAGGRRPFARAQSTSSHHRPRVPPTPLGADAETEPGARDIARRPPPRHAQLFLYYRKRNGPRKTSATRARPAWLRVTRRVDARVAAARDPARAAASWRHLHRQGTRSALLAAFFAALASSARISRAA